MKIAYSWLKEFIDFSEDPQEIGEILTQTGLEVEGIEKVEKIPGGLKGIVIGEVIACEKHPNADKLKLTKVDIGEDALSSIVCGAPNVAKGQKVLVATLNTTLYPTNGEPFKIKKAKIRGEESRGMICAEDEIGLGTSHDGIMVLDTNLPNGTSASTLFETGEDTILEIGLTPNRGDAASHLGTARDLKAYFGRTLSIPKVKSFTIKEDRPIQVEVENISACPRYSGITIRDVIVQDSPDWLKWRLRSIGLEPINNIVDITNYILHGIGQPMHAFDADKIAEGKVLVKTLADQSKFTTLDDKERLLSDHDLMICDGNSEGMCIAGVFGGINSGVSTETRNIFLESAYFSPDWIRATAQRHTLSTDASFRYERGTDPEITIYALKLATSLILEHAGGYVASEIIDIYPTSIKPKRISISFEQINNLIGKELEKNRILEILNGLDIQTERLSDGSLTAVVPTYRSDVTRKADLVEEILRIYGFNSVELDEAFSTNYLAEFKEFEPYRIQESISNYLAGNGYSEILTNSLTNLVYHEKLSIGGQAIDIVNPSSESLTILKTTPLYTMLEAIAYNINRRKENLKLFEFSRTYTSAEDQYQEKEALCMLLTGSTNDEHWLYQPRKTVLYDLSNDIYALLHYVGIRSFESAPSSTKYFDYGISISKGNRLLLDFGKLKDTVVENYGIDQLVFYAEFDWESILSSYRSDIRYEQISKYPEVKRDLSLVIDKSISYAEIQRLAHQYDNNLLNRMNLFSVYEGEKIEKDKKAYAISFFLQDKFKTLTDNQIDKYMNGLMKLFEKEIGAVIRK
jgi:phenylalanyl-tRNA synthetase beta chain